MLKIRAKPFLGRGHCTSTHFRDTQSDLPFYISAGPCFWSLLLALSIVQERTEHSLKKLENDSQVYSRLLRIRFQRRSEPLLSLFVDDVCQPTSVMASIIEVPTRWINMSAEPKRLGIVVPAPLLPCVQSTRTSVSVLSFHGNFLVSRFKNDEVIARLCLRHCDNLVCCTAIRSRLHSRSFLPCIRHIAVLECGKQFWQRTIQVL